MKNQNRPNLTLFHCMNSFEETESMFDNCDVNIVKMACSSMTKDVHLLRAFESGADAVLVLVCPEKGCRYAEGSIRAKKRVNYVKSILDEIGMNSRRLNIYNTTANESDEIQNIVSNTISEVEALGPNPALNRLN